MENTVNQITRAKAGQYLTFYLNTQCYGVPIGSVREINRLAEITPVPQTPNFVAGVLNLRGKVIPIVDLRLKLGVSAQEFTKHTCIIVIEAGYGQVGMIVDSVSGVIDLVENQIEERPVLGNESRLNYVMALGKLENQVIILVNILHALSKDELMTESAWENIDLKDVA